MFMLRDIITAHFSSWAGRLHAGRLGAFDDVTLPDWLERRLGWNAQRDRRRFELVERTREGEPEGKDASRDW
jgi:hypothetical protein